MTHSESPSLPQARQLVKQLRDLGRARAPATLLPAVMSRLELGDGPGDSGDRYFSFVTPLGEVFIAYNDVGISAVMHAATAADFERAFRDRFGRSIAAAIEPPAALVEALSRRLRGDEQVELRFDLRGLSTFERAVLLKALQIPRGEVRPYAWIAREIGRPKAVRAVGAALARNPIPLFIPCHRVVHSDGRLGQYSLGGQTAKRTLLSGEGADPDQIAALARAGVRYYGSDTTRIYCFPTCRHARRITDQHRVLFASAAEALAAGYRPCNICRPAPSLTPPVSCS
jgi:O-6-methylguanine DNA methyltransferase